MDADILRIGVFNSVTDGMYLNLVSEQNILEYLPKQPDSGIRRSARRLEILIVGRTMKYLLTQLEALF